MHVLLVDGLHQWQAVHVKCGKSIIMPGIPDWASESQPYCGEESSWIEYHISLFCTFHGVEYFVGISDKTKLPRGMEVQLKIQEMGIEPAAESPQYSKV